MVLSTITDLESKLCVKSVEKHSQKYPVKLNIIKDVELKIFVQNLVLESITLN